MEQSVIYVSHTKLFWKENAHVLQANFYQMENALKPQIVPPTLNSILLDNCVFALNQLNLLLITAVKNVLLMDSSMDCLVNVKKVIMIRTINNVLRFQFALQMKCSENQNATV
jgi:hypothetical protein